MPIKQFLNLTTKLSLSRNSRIEFGLLFRELKDCFVIDAVHRPSKADCCWITERHL